MVAIITAFQFLSIFPTLIKRPLTAQEMGRAVGWFPLVGIVLGGLLYVLNISAQHFFSVEIASTLTLTAWVILTRAFHLDGLMDTCDGLFGGFTTEKRLEIMRDSRMGAFGVAAGVLLLMLKFSALIALPARDLLPALVISAVLGRWASPLVIVLFPYVREKGTGRAMKENARFPQFLIATLIALSTVWILSTQKGLFLMAISALLAIGLARYFMRLLKGLTGDNYGTITELVEVLVLLVFAIR